MVVVVGQAASGGRMCVDGQASGNTYRADKTPIPLPAHNSTSSPTFLLKYAAPTSSSSSSCPLPPSPSSSSKRPRREARSKAGMDPGMKLPSPSMAGFVAMGCGAVRCFRQAGG